MTKTQDEKDLTDEVLADEIELVGALLAAAAASPGPMSDADIDEALGLPGAGRACEDVPLPTAHRRRVRRGRTARTA